MRVFTATHNRGNEKHKVAIAEIGTLSGADQIEVIWDADKFVGANDFAKALEQIAQRVRQQGMPRGANADVVEA